MMNKDLTFIGFTFCIWLTTCFSKLRDVSLCLNIKQTKQTRQHVHEDRTMQLTTKLHAQEDRISELPDEVLCCILSFLTLRDASRTSILSKRWKTVWTYIDDLDLNAFAKLCVMETWKEYVDQIITNKRPKFVDWVNKMLQSHRTSVLNKFRIHCALNNTFQAELHEWLQYALDKKVQMLEVNLSGIDESFSPKTNNYVLFRPALLEQRGWNSLQELILIYVSVSGSTIEFLLQICKHLECLALHHSDDLRTLEVCDPSLALQHLEINHCPLESLTVSNVNLISLKIGNPGALVIEEVTELVDVGVLSDIYSVEDVSRWLSCCFSKLEVLSLHLSPSQAKEYDGKLPQLPALKQLSLRLALGIEEEECMVGLSSFFRASPNLEKFSITMMYPYEITFRKNSKINAANYFVPLPHIRVVEICRYRGGSIEMELVKYFLDNAIFLGKVIVDPHCKVSTFGCFEEPTFLGRAERNRRAEIANEARRCAEQQLLGIMPSNVTFQIL